MPAVSADIKKLLIATELSVRPEDFVVVYLPQIKAISNEWFRHATTRFAVVIQEPKTITMIIPRRKWLRMQNIFDKYESNGPWKVISLQVGTSIVSAGYLAAVESALTDSKMPVIPISTLKNSHILVPKADLPRAVRLLRELQESCRKKKKKS